VNSVQGAFRLFDVWGIQVYLHWTWFAWGVIEISQRRTAYDSISWNIAEYLALFFIVLLHEFGHALACRQVKGRADTIVLWPLGGIAYVSPPQRPGAHLWSIAAGPLVNVVLVPILFALSRIGPAREWWDVGTELWKFLQVVQIINFGLLCFNLLPIYPLDGGQIARSLLWFVIGRAQSLVVASAIGLAVIPVGVVLVFIRSGKDFSVLSILVALFLFQRCWQGFKYGRLLVQLERSPRHPNFECPSCHKHPVSGPIYTCGKCEKSFDPFSTMGVCPHCSHASTAVPCLLCGERNTIDAWVRTGEERAAE
jgi:Zn-dependent protease